MDAGLAGLIIITNTLELDQCQTSVVTLSKRLYSQANLSQYCTASLKKGFSVTSLRLKFIFSFMQERTEQPHSCMPNQFITFANLPS